MDKIIPFLFIFILIFSPLAFGTVETWSLAIMEISIFLCLLMLTIKNKNLAFYEVPGIIPFALILIYILFQLIPLPPALLKIISPETYRIYQDTVFISGLNSWLSISINKKQTLLEFLRISSYAAFYFLTVQMLTDRKMLRKTVYVIIIFASVLSCFAILQHLLSNNKIYWLRELPYGGSLFGPYVNRNHYAGLMEMIFPLIISIFLLYKPHLHYVSLRDKISALFNLKSTNLYLLIGFGAILTATSVFLTLSRTGIISLCISMIVFGMLFMLRSIDKKRGIIIIIIGILIVLSVGWFGWKPIFERFEKLKEARYNIEETRLQIWNDSIEIVKEFPLTGTGMGTFINIYPRYRTVPGNAVAAHAHNDYLEFFTDGGAILYFLCLLFLIVFAYKVFKAFSKRKDIFSIYIFIASVSGIVSIIIHSATDFNLHIAANGLYFTFLFGLAVSAANTRMHHNLNNTNLRELKISVKAILPIIVVLFLLVSVINSGFLTGEFYFSKIKDIKITDNLSSDELQEIRSASTRASIFDPLEAEYFYASANIEWLLANKEIAKMRYLKAVWLNPVNGEYLQRLGLVMSDFKKYDIADKLLRAGIDFDKQNISRYKRYVAWLFAIGRNDEAKNIIRKAIIIEPEKTREFVTIMILKKLDDYEILSVLPEMPVPYFIFADYLLKTGNEKMAEIIYTNAFDFIKQDSNFPKSYIFSIKNYYVKKGRLDEALNFMKKAEMFFPNDTKIKINIGDIYEKLGIKDKAADEYKKVLTLDPNYFDAKLRLERLSAKK
ncbi:MAG: O-antigen ligase family protein [Nitrospirae bacterium]|nr:O-antigen ligase family protein [Nitrospirota bacterium]